MTRRETLFLLAGAAARAGTISQTDLFVAGEGDYHTYRIPSLIRSKRGTLLTFCEGRKGGRGDSGDIDIVLRRSTDGGRTWRPAATIHDHGADTIGNPCPVVDRKTGVIFLLLTMNAGHVTEKQIIDQSVAETRRVLVSSSRDDGVTWTAPADITGDVKDPSWTWYATGPGVGIQLRNGRMVIPCDHAAAGTKEFHSHCIFSDDGGRTWTRGEPTGEKVNECQVVELRDGSLLLNMRSYHGKNRRAIARSRDGGRTWGEISLDETLVEPVCQASLIRAGGVLLFSNPASRKRERMTVRVSRDEGRTWPQLLELEPGPSAYSCLSPLGRGEFGCLYERGTESPYERITLARFRLSSVIPNPNTPAARDAAAAL
ncbi:MAG: sialidase family protein [Bryobacteraceae bacterium]|nr:sialidase family protein [Bryobacteraceae bacterium]